MMIMQPKEATAMKFSQKIEQCNLSPIRKFHPYAVEAEAKGRKIYHLNIGQPDIETPREFFDAIQNFQSAVLAYAPSPGIPEYLESVRQYYHGLGIELESGDILATNGGSEALQIVLQCILDEGDEVLIPEPFYPNYNTFTRLAGGVVHPIPTSAEEGFFYGDRARIEAEITPKTRAILITNPGNPTGTILSPEATRMIADVARDHNLFIIADEVYREFVYSDQRIVSLAEFPDVVENVVIIDSISKRFSACGARIGALISRNKELIGQALKVCQGRLCSSTLDQLGAAALYEAGPAYFAAQKEEYHRRRDTVMRKLKEIPGVVCKCPEGAFYLMVKLPVDDADAFQKWLLTDFEDHGDTVMFAPGEQFYGTPGKGRSEIRIAYVLKQEDLERAMDLLALGIQAYHARKQ